jgi:excisionase family DNA binding protein
VSRPFLIQKILNAGELPYHYVGNRRRIPTSAVLAYRERQRREQEAALTEMARDAQALGIYE